MHPFFDVYCVILSLFRETSQKTFLDEFDVISQIIQKWMIVRCQYSSTFGSRTYLIESLAGETSEPQFATI